MEAPFSNVPKKKRKKAGHEKSFNDQGDKKEGRGTISVKVSNNEFLTFKNFTEMKNPIKSFALLAVTAASFFTGSPIKAGSTEPGPVNCEPATLVILPAGTLVSLELNQEVSSEAVEVGHTLEFTVRNDVKVNGKVLIRAGSLAEGRVTKVDKFLNACSSCDGTCSSVTVTVESAQAVDGQSILLNATPLTKRGHCAGVGPTTLEIGARITARVRNDVTIIY